MEIFIFTYKSVNAKTRTTNISKCFPSLKNTSSSWISLEFGALYTMSYRARSALKNLAFVSAGHWSCSIICIFPAFEDKTIVICCNCLLLQADTITSSGSVTNPNTGVSHTRCSWCSRTSSSRAAFLTVSDLISRREMRAIGLICSDAHGPSQSRMLSAHTAFRPDAGSFFPATHCLEKTNHSDFVWSVLLVKSL